MEQPDKFLQIAAIREEEGDTLYALDGDGIVWTYYTGRTSGKKWIALPMEKVHL